MTLVAPNKTGKLENGASDQSSTLGRYEKIDCTFASGTYSSNPICSNGESVSPVDNGAAREKSRAFAAACAMVET